MKRIKLLGIIVCALALGLSSCKKAANAEAAGTVEIPNIRIQEATEKNVEQSNELTATVEPQDKNSIAPSAPDVSVVYWLKWVNMWLRGRNWCKWMLPACRTWNHKLKM